MIIIFIAIFLMLIFIVSDKNKERFSYCSNCNHNSYRECINCENCGICIKGNKRFCESGDANGPFNRIDCDNWMHKYRNPPNNYLLITL
jgi:hypothetical protein